MTGPGNQIQAVTGGDPLEGHEDNPDPSSVGAGLVPDQEVDATSIASETDSGVVCRSRPGSYLGTPCGGVGVANPLLARGGGGGLVGGVGQDRAASHQPVIVCSVCRRPTFLDDGRGGPEALPVARILESLVERFRESKQVRALCQTCVEIKEARVFCEDCRALYCGPCFDAAHASSSSSGLVHRSRDAASAKGDPRGPPKCPEHDDGDLRLYCCSCKTLVCPSCQSTGRHEGHAVQDVKAVYKTQKVTAATRAFSDIEEPRSQLQCTVTEYLYGASGVAWVGLGGRPGRKYFWEQNYREGVQFFSVGRNIKNN